MASLRSADVFGLFGITRRVGEPDDSKSLETVSILVVNSVPPLRTLRNCAVHN
jgi:hypothetical protein